MIPNFAKARSRGVISACVCVVCLNNRHAIDWNRRAAQLDVVHRFYVVSVLIPVNIMDQ